MTTAPMVPQPNSKLNGFAVAAFIFGLIGGLIAIVLSIVALRQIKRRGDRGRGLAIAGLAFSAVWVALIGAAGFFALTGGVDRNAEGTITKAGDVRLRDLRAGDCVNGLTGDSALYSLPAVPCAQPHEGEVFAAIVLGPGQWPGEEAADEQAFDICSGRLEAYLASDADLGSMRLTYILPTQESWERDDRRATCIVLGPDGPLAGSLGRQS